MKNRIMTHVVAGYPTEEKCIELMLGMQHAGVYAIEVQIPFSDPTADGPTIMKANDIAVGNGMTISTSFKMIQASRLRGLELPIYVMSYSNKLVSIGLDRFCQEANRSGVAGLIIPDLPFDTTEYSQLAQSCAKFGIILVPVISPGMLPKRFAYYQQLSSKLVYVSSKRGTTGRQLSIQPALVELLKRIRSGSDSFIALGFGIRDTKHVRQALRIADMAVIGSEIIRVVDEGGVAEAIKFVEKLTQA